MNRRGFLKFLGAGVAGIALEEAIPFNRVWFFPKKIVIPEVDVTPFATIYYSQDALNVLKANMPFESIIKNRPPLPHANGPFRLFQYKLNGENF